jgi:hypothetical protein
MNPILLGVCAVIYMIVSIGYLSESRYGMALAFFAYALANVGFIRDALTTGG